VIEQIRHFAAGSKWITLLIVLLTFSPIESAAQGQARQESTGRSSVRVEKVEVSDDWFEVYEILPDVFSIREPGHWEKVISYLVVGKERALLFDTGTGISDIRAVVSELTKLDVLVVNSHSHADHIGGNHQFELIYGLDDETTDLNARGRSIEDSQRFVAERAFNRAPPKAFSRKSFRIHPYRLTKTVNDGELIDLGGRSLEVLRTPGHASDALCLVDRAGRFVLTGDTFYLGRLFVGPGASSLADYAKSAARLADLAGDVDRVLPAHSTTLLKPFFLVRLHEAFKALSLESTDIEGGEREARFGGFSIVVPKPTADP